MQMIRRNGMDELPFYPVLESGCVATHDNSWVIGPRGEVYKCWIDVGDPDWVVGSINGSVPWRRGLIARYMFASDSFTSPECRECVHSTLCNGGCPKSRMAGDSNGTSIHACKEYKERLPEWLEVYLEAKLADPTA
jgi:uncharacterized protein